MFKNVINKKSVFLMDGFLERGSPNGESLYFPESNE